LSVITGRTFCHYFGENKKTGLGKALAITGLNYLTSKSLKQAMLYVDADNAPALAMYQGLGFN
jgi:ribosomal protein S18 acetylase RimI-like enzyme